MDDIDVNWTWTLLDNFTRPTVDVPNYCRFRWLAGNYLDVLNQKILVQQSIPMEQLILVYQSIQSQKISHPPFPSCLGSRESPAWSYEAVPHSVACPPQKDRAHLRSEIRLQRCLAELVPDLERVNKNLFFPDRSKKCFVVGLAFPRLFVKPTKIMNMAISIL